MSIADKMLENAFEGQKLTRKYFVVEIDFSEQSVRDLERIADDVDFTLAGGLSKENIEVLTRTWGSCLGEALCREKEGRWVESPDAVCGANVQVGDNRFDTHEQVRQRLVAGSSKNLWDFFQDAASG